jgi:hypothetical protein
MTLTKLLNTNQAVTYLRIEHGYVTTKATLETRRCRGGGPAYLRIKGKVYYQERQLDEWIHDNSIEYLHTDCPALAGPP